MTVHVERIAMKRFEHYAGGFRVVILNGPRQSGKSVLLRDFRERHGGVYLSLDDDDTLQNARIDPMAFPRYQLRPTLIDEIQRGGDSVVRGIKRVVDEDNTPGQFLLAGSTRFLTVPKISESLAGRAAIVELWPFSVGERLGTAVNLCDQLFNDPVALQGHQSSWRREDYLRAIVDGGYPEVQRSTDQLMRKAWYDAYIATVTQRDISEFAQIHNVAALPALLKLVAARAGSQFVVADIARGLGVSQSTAKSYAIYLETVFQLSHVPAWSVNLTSKVTRTPEVFVTDSGLAAHLLNVTADALLPPGHAALGGLVETFVYTELLKQRSVSETPFTIHHFRDRDGKEIDFVLESADGRVVALEVKASSSPNAGSERHLRWLKEKLGDRMVAGAVLHMGTFAGSLGDGILSLPISALWGHAPWASP